MLRLPLSGKRHATIVSAYALTMTNPDEVKDKFYDDLDSVISATPRTDKLILLGDFNARVGTDHQTWEGVIGTEGIGKCNSNGLLLLKKCAEHELLITNTVFRLPTRNKTSWMQSRSKHWHLTDYVIVRRKDRQDVRVTKTMYGAHCWTDHRLAVSKLNLRIQPARRPQGKKVPERRDVSKLKQDSKRQAFINDICSWLDTMEQSASKRPRWFINQHLASLTRSLPLQWKVKDCKWQTSSPTLEAHFQESCTLMMKSMLGLPKLVQHLDDYVVVFGIKVE